MQHSQDIVVYPQDKSVKNGVYLGEIVPENLKYDLLGVTHRHDCYVIILVLDGVLKVNCELQSFTVGANQLFITKPYQAHTVESFGENFYAYFLSVQDFRVPDDLTYQFFNLPVAQQLVKLNPSSYQTVIETINLLLKYQLQQAAYTTEITNGLFQALIYKIGSMLHTEATVPEVLAANQSNVITSKFKRLITTQSHLKQPSYFADLLFITPAHLNDCVKKTTGQTVSYWLKKSIIDEAKRLLYYTTKSVKEIAFELGYEDHTYFSRLFKKHAKQTPLQFRSDFMALVQ